MKKIFKMMITCLAILFFVSCKPAQSCIIAEKLYKPSVGEQWASMFAKYLNQKAYFTNVLVNQEVKK